MSVDAKWYVVHTYSGYENKVATNIEKMVENRKMQDQILEVQIPTEIVTEIKDDKKREVERKLFPGYVLVKAAVTYDENNVPSMSDDAWFVIRNTRGVTGFVGPESKATPLSEDEVLKLGVEKKSIEVEYQVGDTVRITDERLEASPARSRRSIWITRLSRSPSPRSSEKRRLSSLSSIRSNSKSNFLSR